MMLKPLNSEFCGSPPPLHPCHLKGGKSGLSSLCSLHSLLVEPVMAPGGILYRSSWSAWNLHSHRLFQVTAGPGSATHTKRILRVYRFVSMPFCFLFWHTSVLSKKLGKQDKGFSRPMSWNPQCGGECLNRTSQKRNNSYTCAEYSVGLIDSNLVIVESWNVADAEPKDLELALKIICPPLFSIIHAELWMFVFYLRGGSA